MRRLAALLLLLPVAASAAPQAQRAAPYLNVVVERHVEIPMRDGVVLRATMLRPDAPGKFPALVYRTPYGQERYSDEPDFPMVAAQNGYVVFLVDGSGTVVDVSNVDRVTVQ